MEQNRCCPQQYTRNEIGIKNESIVYISGANFFKIRPELIQSWATIIASVPKSVLILYPFGPAWSDNYPKESLLELCWHTLKMNGVEEDRLIVFDTLPGREEILGILKLCDVYLDAFPYNGATSLIDPLLLGIPPVVVEGEHLRFRQGSAVLKEMGLSELVTEKEAAYIELAVRLGLDRDFRQALAKKILDCMRAKPAFLNPRLFAKKMTAAFKQMMSNVHMSMDG
jgi:predicted O-linked N-acetylglucosamine transferase (SPINDLY family)